jgi:hypothetical protein
MVNLRERAVLKAAQDIWNRTGRPVSADAIAQAAGFDDETTQQALGALYSKGFFGDALRGDDRIDSVAYSPSLVPRV